MGLILFLTVVGLTGYAWGLDVAVFTGVIGWMAWVIVGDYRAWMARR